MLRHGKVKAAVQGALSLLPRSQSWNYLLQQYVTRTLPLTAETVAEKLGKAAKHLDAYRRESNGELPGCTLELGTGWYPLAPLGLYLAGVQRVITCDIQSLINGARVRAAMGGTLQAADNGAVASLDAERLAHLRDIHANSSDDDDGREVLQALGIEARIADICALDLDPGSVDLAHSNNTFEHVPREALAAILSAFHRYLGESGIQSHHVDLADHYFYFDPSIGERHFLRYTEAQWRKYNNHLQYQNRLLHSDYQKLHADAGFAMVQEVVERCEASALAAITPAPPFAGHPLEELLVTSAWFISRAQG